MKPLKGSLTPAQHEIMQTVWAAGAAGASVGEIWKQTAAARAVSRTTILNLVDRLEKRGWLKRLPGDSANRFRATLGPEATAAKLSEDFVDGFFGGSATNLVLSLLGNKKLDAGEIRRLRALLDAARPKSLGGVS